MADNKRYYYLKLKENFFESDEMKILQSMPDGYIYSDILLKLYLKSLRDGGRLMYKGIIPYTTNVLSTLTGHQVGTVEKALEVFQDLSLVEILDNGVIFMMDIQNFIGKSSSEADRQREYQARIKLEKSTFLGDSKQEQCYKPCKESNKESCKESVLEIRDKEIKRIETNYQQIADMYNATCVSFPKLVKLSDARKKSIRARLNTYSLEDFQKLFEMAESSSFLKGKNDRNWMATFDWLIKDSNMAKVLDGNYADKDCCQPKAVPQGKNNGFNNFSQRDYCYDELERQMLLKSMM